MKKINAITVIAVLHLLVKTWKKVDFEPSNSPFWGFSTKILVSWAQKTALKEKCLYMVVNCGLFRNLRKPAAVQIKQCKSFPRSGMLHYERRSQSCHVLSGIGLSMYKNIILNKYHRLCNSIIVTVILLL